MTNFKDNGQISMENATENKPEKIFIVNCNKCGAALKVKDGAYAYICGACKNLFQIRKKERIIQTAGAAPKTEEKPVEEPLEEPIVEESFEEEGSVQLDISDIEMQPVTEEPVEEIPEEVVEEPVEEIPEEVVEEPVEEIPEVVVEEPVEEVSEVVVEVENAPAWEPKTDDEEEEGWDEEE